MTAKLEWSPLSPCDEDLRMKEVSIEYERGSVDLIVSQDEEHDWRWTFHVELEALIEPGVYVDTAKEAERLVLEHAATYLRALLAKVDALRQTDRERAAQVRACGFSDAKLRTQVAAMRSQPTLKNVLSPDLSGLPDVIDELLARRADANEPDGFRRGADVVHYDAPVGLA